MEVVKVIHTLDVLKSFVFQAFSVCIHLPSYQQIPMLVMNCMSMFDEFSLALSCLSLDSENDFSEDISESFLEKAAQIAASSSASTEAITELSRKLEETKTNLKELRMRHEELETTCFELRFALQRRVDHLDYIRRTLYKEIFHLKENLGEISKKTGISFDFITGLVNGLSRPDDWLPDIPEDIDEQAAAEAQKALLKGGHAVLLRRMEHTLGKRFQRDLEMQREAIENRWRRMLTSKQSELDEASAATQRLEKEIMNKLEVQRVELEQSFHVESDKRRVELTQLMSQIDRIQSMDIPPEMQKLVSERDELREMVEHSAKEMHGLQESLSSATLELHEITEENQRLQNLVEELQRKQTETKEEQRNDADDPTTNSTATATEEVETKESLSTQLSVCKFHLESAQLKCESLEHQLSQEQELRMKCEEMCEQLKRVGTANVDYYGSSSGQTEYVPLMRALPSRSGALSRSGAKQSRSSRPFTQSRVSFPTEILGFSSSPSPVLASVLSSLSLSASELPLSPQHHQQQRLDSPQLQRHSEWSPPTLGPPPLATTALTGPLLPLCDPSSIVQSMLSLSEDAASGGGGANGGSKFSKEFTCSVFQNAFSTHAHKAAVATAISAAASPPPGNSNFTIGPGGVGSGVGAVVPPNPVGGGGGGTKGLPLGVEVVSYSSEELQEIVQSVKEFCEETIKTNGGDSLFGESLSYEMAAKYMLHQRIVLQREMERGMALIQETLSNAIKSGSVPLPSQQPSTPRRPSLQTTDIPCDPEQQTLLSPTQSLAQTKHSKTAISHFSFSFDSGSPMGGGSMSDGEVSSYNVVGRRLKSKMLATFVARKKIETSGVLNESLKKTESFILSKVAAKAADGSSPGGGGSGPPASGAPPAAATFAQTHGLSVTFSPSPPPRDELNPTASPSQWQASDEDPVTEAPRQLLRPIALAKNKFLQLNHERIGLGEGRRESPLHVRSHTSLGFVPKNEQPQDEPLPSDSRSPQKGRRKPTKDIARSIDFDPKHQPAIKSTTLKEHHKAAPGVQLPSISHSPVGSGKLSPSIGGHVEQISLPAIERT